MAASPAYEPGSYDTKGAIFDAVHGFHTYSGKSLEQFLAGYGLEVTAVDVRTVESLGPQDGDEPGDVDYTVVVKGHHMKTLPCDLLVSQQTLDAFSGDGLPLEFVRRHGKFPVLTENSDRPTDAMIFWIATGRCSKAY